MVEHISRAVEGAASVMGVILHDLALLAQYAELLWLISQLNVVYTSSYEMVLITHPFGAPNSRFTQPWWYDNEKILIHIRWCE